MPSTAFKYRISKVSRSSESHRTRRGRRRQPSMRDGTCGRGTRTLAPESRHIVAFLPSGTTSHAAVNTLQVSLYGVDVRARLTRPARVKGFRSRVFLGWHRSVAPGGGSG